MEKEQIKQFQKEGWVFYHMYEGYTKDCEIHFRSPKMKSMEILKFSSQHSHDEMWDRVTEEDLRIAELKALAEEKHKEIERRVKEQVIDALILKSKKVEIDL